MPVRTHWELTYCFLPRRCKSCGRLLWLDRAWHRRVQAYISDWGVDLWRCRRCHSDYEFRLSALQATRGGY